ncbi:MAG: guanylate kinase [Candidatus Babeliales bacterium]
MKKPGKLFVVSAPSGAGKTTLITTLCERIGDQHAFKRVITYTSRQPRQGDQEGKDYHFISKQEFEVKIQEGFFIEWSNAYGNYYGSPRSILNELTSGVSFFLIIDRAGAQVVSEVHKESVLIWIHTKTIEILENRLRSRNTEQESEILRRLSLAKQEIDEELQKKFYQYHVLNDNFEKAIQELVCIVFDEIENS